jgi:hypothetical protein
LDAQAANAAQLIIAAKIFSLDRIFPSPNSRKIREPFGASTLGATRRTKGKTHKEKVTIGLQPDRGTSEKL